MGETLRSVIQKVRYHHVVETLQQHSYFDVRPKQRGRPMLAACEDLGINQATLYRILAAGELGKTQDQLREESLRWRLTLGASKLMEKTQ